MSSSNPIQIDVTTRYLEEQSEPVSKRFAFAYTIAITNNGISSVQLLNRHWKITDDNNGAEEVKGEGVIGKQPNIAPGETFTYTSGALIKTEVGTMQGSYEMCWADGVKFNAAIAPFLLAIPHTVH
ncbi:MAG TPA: Co2+/Mg2+ efflux protein ApaG [Gammaproteobacteria bacterium]|nr:Co2+/Mg2+ efflux protein ApaG [Gammaproteobacteria bacterium]|tara:strand:+ start:644 stop:1021 length:378 start_codon:yes stop_codon:yes gene_type:complete